MAVEVPDEAFDKFDWIYFVVGTGFTLLAVVALKFIFDIGNGGGGNCYHSHFHGNGAPQISHGSVYGIDHEGKIHRRGYL